MNETESDSEKYCKTKSTQMKPQKFNGKGELADFLSQFEACRDYDRWTDKVVAFNYFIAVRKMP